MNSDSRSEAVGNNKKYIYITGNIEEAIKKYLNKFLLSDQKKKIYIFINNCKYHACSSHNLSKLELASVLTVLSLMGHLLT